MEFNLLGRTDVPVRKKMNTTLRITIAAVSFVALRLVASPIQDFQKTFTVDKSNLETTGNNAYFPLKPGLKLEYKNKDTYLIFSVLDETETVDGVKCRVIEEHETKNGELVEISRNFFVTDKSNNNVYYFGEDVDNFKGGKIISHDSAWRSGVKGATFGLFMPGKVEVGHAFYQEIAPDVAMDRIKILSNSETIKTPSGVFKDCVKFEETTPMEPGVTDYKRYAPGVGMVQDGDMKLVKKH